MSIRTARRPVAAAVLAACFALPSGAATAGALGTAPAAIVPASVSTDDAGAQAQTRVGYARTMTANPGAAPATMELRVPAGTTPVSLQATLTGPAGRTAAILVGDRVALPQAEIPANGRYTARVPLTAADLTGAGVVAVSLRQRVSDPTQVCGVEDGPVQLSAPSLVLAGQEKAPTTLAVFFPPVTPRIHVVVPARAPDDVLAAALAAVGALSRRYPTSDVRLGTAAPRSGGIGERTVIVNHANGAATTTVLPAAGVPTLVVSGNGEELRQATSALDSVGVALADGATSRGLSSYRVSAAPALTQTLAQFGAERLSLGGYGTSSGYLGISQSSFGRPVSAIALHLEGTHSAIPKDAAATLEVRWNDLLVASTDLSTTRDRFTVEATVPEAAIQAENGLRLTVHAVPVGGRCERDYQGIGFSVDIDGSSSTVTAQAGAGALTGFPRFPQTLGGALPVAARGTGDGKVANTVRAASVVGALQRASRTPLDVSLVDPDEFVAGARSGLLVGATERDSNVLGAPLRLSGMRLLSGSRQEGRVGTDQPFGALQAVHSGSREVLMLGGWATRTGAEADLIDRLTGQLAGQPWAQLSGDLYLSNPNTEPFTLSAREVYPQAQPLEERRSHMWWWAVGALLIAALLAIRGLVARRQRREISGYVRAQEEADALATVGSGNPAPTPPNPASPPAGPGTSGP